MKAGPGPGLACPKLSGCKVNSIYQQKSENIAVSLHKAFLKIVEEGTTIYQPVSKILHKSFQSWKKDWSPLPSNLDNWKTDTFHTKRAHFWSWPWKSVHLKKQSHFKPLCKKRGQTWAKSDILRQKAPKNSWPFPNSSLKSYKGIFLSKSDNPVWRNSTLSADSVVC